MTIATSLLQQAYLVEATAVALSLLCFTASAPTLKPNCISAIIITSWLAECLPRQWMMVVQGRRGWLASKLLPVEVEC